jgi:signal transduction histidine kinase
MFILSTSALLGVNGYFRVRREVGLFESDKVRDHELMANVAARAAAAVWQTQGATRAMEVLRELGGRTAQLKIGWRPLPIGSRDPLDGRLERLGPSRTLTLSAVETGTGLGRCTYATLTSPGAPPGAVFLCESAAAERAYLRKTITETCITTLALAAVCALLSGVLGVWLIGKPIAALSAAARRIGAGDFSVRLHLRQKDELSGLAEDMNAMSAQLAVAAERVAQETASRLAAVEQLRHADRLSTVGKLASGLAHELGTPLNVIEVRAGMIASGETSRAESMDYARVIREASERMTRLIRRLLDFARPRLTNPAYQEVFPLVTKTVELLSPMASKKQICLEATCASQSSAAVVDSDQIQQVLTNLIVNAIQAMDGPGVIELRVGVAVAKPPASLGRPEAPHVCIAVEDHGSGMAKGDVSHIFEPFFTTKDVGSGTGLGLAIAYGIMRDHGGWLEVETALGKGSVFRAFLRQGSV